MAQTLKEWRFRFTPPGKDPQLAEIFAKDKGNVDWVIEESNYKYHLWPHDHLQI